MQEMQEILGSDPGLGRSPGEGNGNPLQYSWLENSMDRIHGVTEVRHNWAINTAIGEKVSNDNNLLSETLKARRKWHNIFQELK